MSSSRNLAGASTSNSNVHPLPTQGRSNEEELWMCLPLYRVLLRGNELGFQLAARSLLRRFPLYDAMSSKITRAGDTSLHVLVGAGNWFDSLEISVEGLAFRNGDGHTPLCVAAMVGNMKAAQELLKLEMKLPPTLRDRNDAVGPYPIIEATRFGHKKMVLLLIGDFMARKMGRSQPTIQSPASIFLHQLVLAGFYDVLLALVRRHPYLSRAEFSGDESLLSLMAQKPSAFWSGTQLGSWQRLLADFILIQEKLESRLADIGKFLVLNQQSAPQHHHELTTLAWLARMIDSCINHVAPIVKYIKDTKLMHEDTLANVKYLCEEFMKEYNIENIEPILRKALLLAASSGVSEIIDRYPDAIWFVDSENHNLFHLAVINRHEKVFNLIYQLSSYKHLVIADEDASGNNILHMAGKLAPFGRLYLISGAALQMQRELQWFQEVEKFVHPTCRTKRNSYGKTPKMVFTEEHKELVKEGEKWMKETANSCIFVSALTATVGFAASITVPGGNNQNNGFPLFFNNPAFTIFAVSVAFCLFSSVASVLMFLSILASRYAEEDFLKSLPNRLILGLGTLFISMTAFGATIYLVFGQRKGWILVPIGIATLVPAGIAVLLPVILFESLQFPLLLDMFMSTYGPSIFHKQSSRLLH